MKISRRTSHLRSRIPSVLAWKLEEGNQRGTDTFAFYRSSSDRSKVEAAIRARIINVCWRGVSWCIEWDKGNTSWKGEEGETWFNFAILQSLSPLKLPGDVSSSVPVSCRGGWGVVGCRGNDHPGLTANSQQIADVSEEAERFQCNYPLNIHCLHVDIHLSPALPVGAPYVSGQKHFPAPCAETIGLDASPCTRQIGPRLAHQCSYQLLCQNCALHASTSINITVHNPAGSYASLPLVCPV